MTRWEYLGFSVKLVPADGDEDSQPNRWQFTITKRHQEPYQELLAACNKDLDTGDIWAQLGEDGWELVTAIDSRRDRVSHTYSDPDGRPGPTQIYEHATSINYIFKRPRTG